MICIQLKIKCKIILLKTFENGLNKSYIMTYQITMKELASMEDREGERRQSCENGRREFWWVIKREREREREREFMCGIRERELQH
jgi:hypothetical protein